MGDRVSDYAVVKTAIGRLLRMMSRPAQPGDVEIYWKVRDILMGSAGEQADDYTPNWARDRNIGAQGD